MTENGRKKSSRPMMCLLFALLFGTYGYFWQARDANISVRLGLTYALAERGTFWIDGYDDNSVDRSKYEGHIYSSKAPGQALLALPFYIPLHFSPIHAQRPLDEIQIYWWPDYVLTLATCGVMTASIALMIYCAARRLGCEEWSSAIVALGYGLGTNAFTYATLFYGHQTAAFCLFACWMLLWTRQEKLQLGLRFFCAGLLAGFAVVIEFTVAFVSASLLIYAWQRMTRKKDLVWFCLGAGVCAALLAACQYIAFGSIFRLGYFYHVNPEFSAMHPKNNPMGVGLPKWDIVWLQLFCNRGFVLFAPVTVVSVFGAVVLWQRRKIAISKCQPTNLQSDVLNESKTAPTADAGQLCDYSLFGLIIFPFWTLLNLLMIHSSYPGWSGGFSTGPRYLLPAIPFLMVPVAAFVTGRRKWAQRLTLALAIFGFVICFACTAYGARLHEFGIDGVTNALIQKVIPGWRNGNFDRNMGKFFLYPIYEKLSPGWKWLTLAPALAFIFGGTLLIRKCANRWQNLQVNSSMSAPDVD